MVLREMPKRGEVYRHFKGSWYKVIGIAIDSISENKLVIYQSLAGEKMLFAKPVDSFLEEVDRRKYPWTIQRYRMEKFK